MSPIDPELKGFIPQGGDGGGGGGRGGRRVEMFMKVAPGGVFTRRNLVVVGLFTKSIE
jgi:hypothetical protein